MVSTDNPKSLYGTICRIVLRGRCKEQQMYTIQMILDQLSASSVIIRSIVSSDQVSAIRIYKNDTMKDNILSLLSQE